MPRRRARTEGRLEDAVEALADALADARAPWMFIGGIALIARGVRRFTADVDAVVRGDAIAIEQLQDVLARYDIVARIPDAVAFARVNMVLLARHAPTGVDLDVSLAWSQFEREAIRAATRAAFGRVRAPMSTAADLVVLKAIAGRAKDLEDIVALLVLHPDIDVPHARARVAQLSELAEAPELVEQFDAVIRRAAEGSASSPLEKKKRKGPRRRR